MSIKKVLLTGATGFIGKNIASKLKNDFYILSPSRHELDLYSFEQLAQYIEEKQIDIIIHSANPNPVKNTLDENKDMCKDSLKIFLNIYNLKDKVDKILYFGSGAEYGKDKDIIKAKELDINNRIPKDDYGFAKYIMNNLAKESNNIYNLRIFACYGPNDYHTKFITHCINCCMKNEPITIRQDCYFDYMHVYDLAKIVWWFIINKPKYNDYNVTSGERYSLLEIAEEVSMQMKNENGIIINMTGFNKEYTADNKRLLQECKDIEFIPLKEGIKMQIKVQEEEI